MKLFARKDIFIILIFAAAAAVFLLFGAGKSDGKINIYVGGELYESVPVGTARTVTVDQGSGKVNVIVITETGVKMESSTCPNQDCVMKGELPLDGDNLISDWIICLPNAVSVEVSP